MHSYYDKAAAKRDSADLQLSIVHDFVVRLKGAATCRNFATKLYRFGTIIIILLLLWNSLLK
jgi:hypothetical protein